MLSKAVAIGNFSLIPIRIYCWYADSASPYLPDLKLGKSGQSAVPFAINKSPIASLIVTGDVKFLLVKKEVLFFSNSSKNLLGENDLLATKIKRFLR